MIVVHFVQSSVDYKKAVHTVKKASSDTVRLQKKANKGVL